LARLELHAHYQEEAHLAVLLNERFGWELVDIILELYLQARETLILHLIAQASKESIILVHCADIILCDVLSELIEFILGHENVGGSGVHDGDVA
jgi:hypothetical protein